MHDLFAQQFFNKGMLSEKLNNFSKLSEKFWKLFFLLKFEAKKSFCEIKFSSEHYIANFMNEANKLLKQKL